ncbi:ammonia monooxygenase [Aeromicrobium sp. Root495]|uniref:AbrB family transcriptional regulator n=1 Tax=Aeromicrobium sp. Root495 TaxID=1736550 RepID=UPI0006FAA391|nr:AbrB family transcriptional regulator [Aeromicrobium sp. Root495]KQY59119.1 ammonia monooxygenase [Aeromicrobium sp. Root495]
MKAWLGLAALVAAASAGFTLVGLPSPLLFGGLVGALAYALLPTRELTLPRPLFLSGQGVIGVVVGASVEWSTLGELGWDWPAVVLVSALTLVISVLAGQMLRLHGVSAVTASFASIAGGASGMTALARDLGADDRVVTVIQYLRVLIILFSMPAVVAVAFHVQDSGGGAPAPAWDVSDVVFCVLAVGLGLAVGKWGRFPSPAVLGPLLAAVVLRLLPVFDDAVVPLWVQAIGYVAIGVQVGLRFTLDSLRSISRMVPTALVSILITLVLCAAMAWGLSAATGVSRLDAYLATTPGGLYAVLATTTATGGDVTFVTAVQMLRLLMVLLLAPVLARLLSRPE